MPGLIFNIGGKFDAASVQGAFKSATTMARRAASEMAGSMRNTLLGAVGVYSIGDAFRKALSSAEELVNTSKRLALPIEKLQILRRAAEDVGVEFGALAGAFEKINEARAEALGGNAGTMAAFSALGVNREQLQTQSAAELFTGAIAATVSNTNPEAIAKPLREVFGKGFGQFIPVLASDFDELGQKMRDTGALMDGKIAAKLDAIGDQFELLGNIVTAQLAPALLSFAEWAYKLSLESGGKAAGAAGYWGAIYQNMLDAPNQAVDPRFLTDDGKRINFWKKLWSELKGEGGALGTMAANEKPYAEKITEFQNMLKRAEDALKLPAPAVFTDMEKKVEERIRPAKPNSAAWGELTAAQRAGAWAGLRGVAIRDLTPVRQLEQQVQQTKTLKSIEAKLDKSYKYEIPGF